MGDFNSTCFPHERLREEINVINMANFNDFISSGSLIDQNLQNMFEVLIVGDKSSSDHNPLIWGKKSLFWGPKPFRFFNGWFEVPNFIEVCKTLWCSYNDHGYAAYVILAKSQKLKEDLKLWNNEHVNKSRLHLAILESQIHDFSQIQEIRELSNVEALRLVDLKLKRKALQRQEKRKMMFKSRYNWLRFGDKNTKYFHIMAKIKNNSSIIAGLQINDVWIENPVIIKEHVLGMFCSLFTAQVTSFDGLDWPAIGLTKLLPQQVGFLDS
ncbi:uncharacterized protein [Rutidosis leptorrhynchoides]|uniref:uncharacterized protein n=1 Tax=Rutidosis leptorrhynchoides TaxID=125765 RepID=UPI003A99A2CB